MIARFVIDTSAAARMWLAGVAERLEPLISGGLVASCASLDAVALYSARNPEEYEHVRADRREAYEYLPTDDGHWQRTFDAQRELARTGQHRAVGIADLLTRSWATQHHMTVLHYEADFEMAAEVLPFEHRWVSRGERCGPTAHGVRRVVSEGGHGTSAHASRSAAERAASAWTQSAARPPFSRGLASQYGSWPSPAMTPDEDTVTGPGRSSERTVAVTGVPAACPMMARSLLSAYGTSAPQAA